MNEKETKNWELANQLQEKIFFAIAEFLEENQGPDFLGALQAIRAVEKNFSRVREHAFESAMPANWLSQAIPGALEAQKLRPVGIILMD